MLRLVVCIEDLAGFAPDQISSPGQRPRRRVALWGGLAALAVAVGGFVALGREDTSSVANDTASDSLSAPSFDPSRRPGRCDAPTPRTERTPAEQLASRDASRAAMEEAHRTGWTRFRDRLADGSGWLCGWTSTIPSERAHFDEVQNYRSTDGRQAIYDAVDGNVIGFSFAFLGAFTPEQVAEPGFDPASMRFHRHGCDPLLDSSCQARP
jgi:hypothetical protein